MQLSGAGNKSGEVMQLTDQDIETIKELLRDHGSDCPSADCAAVQALGEKLGVYEPELPPTAEELKRREERANSPFAKLMKDAQRGLIESMGKQLLTKTLFDEPQVNVKIGSTLRIRLPHDYQVKAE